MKNTLDGAEVGLIAWGGIEWDGVGWDTIG